MAADAGRPRIRRLADEARDAAGHVRELDSAAPARYQPSADRDGIRQESPARLTPRPASLLEGDDAFDVAERFAAPVRKARRHHRAAEEVPHEHAYREVPAGFPEKSGVQLRAEVTLSEARPCRVAEEMAVEGAAARIPAIVSG